MAIFMLPFSTLTRPVAPGEAVSLPPAYIAFPGCVWPWKIRALFLMKASDLLPAGSIYGLETGKSVEISIPGGAVGGGHPIHLHGHAFNVIRSAGSDTYNYVNPVRRDTVNIGTTGDNVTIRFQTNNPGPWFIHCHIDWHLEAGLAVVMAEGIEETNTTNIVPADWSTLCPVYDALNASDH
ncbi:laccase [Heterobasidion irregulare TC 32-1]|uniref:Laccase n=1 Tax=Heterobasidion irregulare (strain TC 32-1) TaxID=747525 RepID=W4K593_HETIT|nr:laccase [Heterobasidion irregulare TC 32-1]ETW80211.1 laccase [Heterobasidion irregulare TC 32-1]